MKLIQKETKMNIKKRDFNIALSLANEINLRPRVVKDKTKYTRKQKHKQKEKNICLQKIS